MPVSAHRPARRAAGVIKNKKKSPAAALSACVSHMPHRQRCLLSAPAGVMRPAAALRACVSYVLKCPLTAATEAAVQAIKVGTPVSIACSEKHALLVTDNGEVLAWGEDGSGRLGGGGGGGGGGGRGGADEALQRQNEHVSVPLPRPVRGLQGVTVMKVACSSHHSLALSTGLSFARARSLTLSLALSLSRSLSLSLCLSLCTTRSRSTQVYNASTASIKQLASR